MDRGLAGRQEVASAYQWHHVYMAPGCKRGTTPQGSVLGPLLFLINIDDLDNGIINWILKFADDTIIFGKVQFSSAATAPVRFEYTVAVVKRLAQMLFNIEKCKVMHFGHHNQGMDYTLDNRVLQKVHEERDLGVIISVDLKASLQCVKAYSTANRILGVINRSIVYKSRNIYC